LGIFEMGSQELFAWEGKKEGKGKGRGRGRGRGREGKGGNWFGLE
jgi:hypothetical protein